MRVPALAGRGRDRVVLENRGVVDQHADRPERRRGARQQARRPPLSSARSAASATALPPARLDLDDQRLGLVLARRDDGSRPHIRLRPAPATRRGRCGAPPPVTSAACGTGGGRQARRHRGSSLPSGAGQRRARAFLGARPHLGAHHLARRHAGAAQGRAAAHAAAPRCIPARPRSICSSRRISSRSRAASSNSRSAAAARMRFSRSAMTAFRSLPW